GHLVERLHLVGVVAGVGLLGHRRHRHRGEQGEAEAADVWRRVCRHGNSPRCDCVCDGRLPVVAKRNPPPVFPRCTAVPGPNLDGIRGPGKQLRPPRKSPATRGSPVNQVAWPGQTAIGSLKASGSSLKSPIGMQEQNTFLSPWTLSTRATGGQYFCCFSVASGNTASSRL